MCGQSAHPSVTVSSHLCRGKCDQAAMMPRPPARTLPRSPVPEGSGSGGVGAREPWGCRPSKAPQARGPRPGWVFPSRGGRREAGRGRGRFGKATSPGFPTAPARQCPRRTPAGGGSARPGEVGSGLLISVPEAGLVLPGVCVNPYRKTPPYHSPKPAVSSRPEAEAAPQSKWGVCSLT